MATSCINRAADTDDGKDAPMAATEITLELLDYRVTILEEDRRKFLAALETIVLLGATIGETQRAMASSNSNAEQLGRWIETVDKRVQTLEVEAPLIRMAAKWVIAGVLGVFGLVGMAAWTILFDGVRPLLQR